MLSGVCPFFWNKHYHCPINGETRDSCYCSRRWLLFSVTDQSYFSQKFNNNRNLTVILSLSLFKRSWSASFSDPFRGQPLNSRWCVCVQQLASFHSIPSFSRGSLCTRSRARLCVSEHPRLSLAIQCFLLLRARKPRSLACSPATSPDVQL